MEKLIKEFEKTDMYGFKNVYSEYLAVKTDLKHFGNKFKVVYRKFKNTYSYFEKDIKDNLTLDDAENFVKNYKL